MRIIFLFVFLYSLVDACGGGYWYGEYEFKFLDKRDFAFANISNNLNYVGIYNDIIDDYDKKVKEQNLKEWQKEFGKNVTKKQIEDFIYKNKNLSNIKNKEILDYITFLNKQSAYVRRNMWYSEKPSKKNVPPLINEALAKIDVVKSKYLKLRYFFLALRLAHYNNYNAYEIYKKYNYLQKGSKSIVNDWIQGLYAGILVRKKQVVKGVYEFTKLFEQNKLNWYLAFYNFKYIKTDEQWKKLLSMAKNKEEKIKFFTLRALNVKSNTIEELKNIAKIDINSKFYDLLIFRELVASQEFFHKTSEDYYGSSYYYYTPRKVEFKAFRKYLKTISKKDMYIVNLALSYLYFYENDIKSSKKWLEKTFALAKKEQLHEVNTLKYILYLNDLKKIDKNSENDIAKRMNKLIEEPCNKKNINDYTFYKIKKLYQKRDDTFKSFLSESIIRNYVDTNAINLDKYNKIKALETKKDKSALEKYMLEYIKKDKNINKKLESAHIKILLNNLKFEEALKLIKPSNKKREFNVFNNFIVGNNRKHSSITYSLYESIKKIVEIKNNLKSNPNSTMDNYLYASALYNLSYWGNSNYITTVYRSNYVFKEKELEKQKINLSIKHYKKALETAKNKEFRAKIVYMLAKSELALFDIKNSQKIKYAFMSDRDGYEFNRSENWTSYLAGGYGKFFDELKKEYSNTSYYKELLHECGSLRHYYDNNEYINYLDSKLKSSSKSGLKLLNEIEQNVKKKDKTYDYDELYFWKLLKYIPISNKTVTSYNNIAYYLNENKQKNTAIFLLNKIIEKYPNRTVAYYNLADAYWAKYNYDLARKNYKIYMELMKEAGKENKIPKVIKERILLPWG